MDIVILHGWGHSKAVWAEFSGKFDDRTTVLDLPGFGDEQLISPLWGVDEYAKWVVSKLRSKKLSKVVIIGHSFGGKVAAAVALIEPSLVAKLILIASPLLRRPSKVLKVKIIAYKVAKKLLPNMNIGQNIEYKEAIKMRLGEVFRNSVNYDATDKLKNISCPTLIIWGEKDPTSDIKIGEEMHRLIKHSRFEIIKGAGHNIQFENPHMLYGLINKFI